MSHIKCKKKKHTFRMIGFRNKKSKKIKRKDTRTNVNQDVLDILAIQNMGRSCASVVTKTASEGCNEGMSGNKNECFICLEAKDNLMCMKGCCSGHVCETCLEKWVETRVVWPTERNEGERCPRCRQTIADQDVLTLIKIALDKRQLGTKPSWFSSSPSSSSSSLPLRSPANLVNEIKTNAWKYFKTNACPSCKRIIYKDGGCPNMTCRCGHRFRWHNPAEGLVLSSTILLGLSFASYLRNGGLAWILPWWIRVVAAALIFGASALSMGAAIENRSGPRFSGSPSKNRNTVIILAGCWLACLWPAVVTMYFGCTFANAVVFWQEMSQRGLLLHCFWVSLETPIGSLCVFPGLRHRSKRQMVLRRFACVCLGSFGVIQGTKFVFDGMELVSSIW